MALVFLIPISKLYSIRCHLWSFNISFILLPGAFRLVQLGFLPKFEELYGVYPNSVHAFLDFVESFVIPNGRQPLRMASILCRDSPGLEEVRERYLRSRQTNMYFLLRTLGCNIGTIMFPLLQEAIRTSGGDRVVTGIHPLELRAGECTDP